MTSIITILTIALIECVFGVIYVDLKNFIISNGVNVFHGRFNISSIYFMFVGDSEPIRELRYGNEVIFPKENVSKELNLFVELFIINKVTLVSFYVHTFNDGLLKSVNRYTISISSDKYSNITNEEFMSNINKPILVSFDIGPRPKHPFINITTFYHINCQMVRYKFTYNYNCFVFDGISGPLYKFGYVYDSNHPAVVGYTKRPYLIEECVLIKIYNLYEPFRIELYGHYLHRYEMRPILCEEYWFLTEYSDIILSDQMNRNAIRLYKLYRRHNKGLPLITLDTSELVTPELFGIEKVTGSIGKWNYTLYKHERILEYEDRISAIIDSNMIYRNIYIPKIKYKYFNIEVYRNNKVTYVILNQKYEIKNRIKAKKSRLFKRGGNEEKYNQVENRDRKKIIEKFEESYPIKLDITVDEEQPSLFEKKELSDGDMTIHHFSIRETNDFGESTLNKYVFGAVYATRSFQLGNIPLEPFRKNKVMITSNINTSKFIVRNKSTFDELNTPQYQLFRLRT